MIFAFNREESMWQRLDDVEKAEDVPVDGPWTQVLIADETMRLGVAHYHLTKCWKELPR